MNQTEKEEASQKLNPKEKKDEPHPDHSLDIFEIALQKATEIRKKYADKEPKIIKPIDGAA